MYFKRGVKEIPDHKKICIIGAGASGLAAAISASRAGAEVCVLEHRAFAAKKVSVSGNGKCNFTNLHMDASCYHMSSEGGIGHLLEVFRPKDTIDFFNSLGIESYDRFGYVYPKDKNAQDVADILIKEAGEIHYNEYNVDIEDLVKKYDAVILACGSRACKKTGSDGSGYKYLERLGVKYTRILPALCPVICNTDEIIKSFPQKRFFAKISVFVDGNKKYSDCGEIQIRENGLSGIPVMNISRYVSRGIDSGQDVILVVDLGIEADDFPNIVRNRLDFDKTFELKPQGLKYTLKAEKISRFDNAQICTGGVPLEDLDDNFMLKHIPNVFVVGEMVDVDGICGGYNLHFAFASGCIAGKAAAS